MQSPALNFTPRGLYIGGQWVSPADDASFVSINPSNMENLADVPAAGDVDVDRAVKAAKAAFKEWSRVPIKERARCLELLADRIEENADALALMDAVDSGNAIVGMRGDMIWTADWLRYCAGLLTEIKGETFSQGDRHRNLTRRQPFGVVAKINPFNHPFRFCAEKAAAPLAAGNTVVIKGSEQAPLSSLQLGELCDGIFPDGVINILAGDGKVGSALVRHPDVRRIGFVGSVATGRGHRQRGRGRPQARQPGTRWQEPDRDFSRCRSQKGGGSRHQGHEYEPAGSVVQLDIARVRSCVAA
jgi:betaine-aldehyde dehydrogenase